MKATLLRAALWLVLERLLVPSVRWFLRRRVNRVLDEVNTRLDPRKFNMRTVPGRLRRMKREPLRGILALEPDLGAVLQRLARRLEERRHA